MAELGPEAVPNLVGLGTGARGVYLPTHVEAMSLPLPAGDALRCASLPGLREELTALASRWSLPLDDEGLAAILDHDEAEVRAFAHLALAANEACRRDCPLWVVV